MQQPKFLGLPVGLVGVASVLLLVPVIGWFGELQGRGSPWAYPMALAFWLCWAFVMAYLVRRDGFPSQPRSTDPTD